MFWGLGMQFCIGLFVIRTDPGFVAFDWLGKQVQVRNSKLFSHSIHSVRKRTDKCVLLFVFITHIALYFLIIKITYQMMNTKKKTCKMNN